MANVTAEQREVLASRFVSSYESDETAAVFRKRQGAVRALPTCALHALRERLEQDLV